MQINRIQHTKRLRTGLFWEQPLNKRWSADLECFTGQDPRRTISWGSLYGYGGRLRWRGPGQSRLTFEWFEFSERNSAVSGGRTRLLRIGLDVKF